MKHLETYIWRYKMNDYQPYSGRAEHDFYKQLSSYEADEKEKMSQIYLLLGEVHQINIARGHLIDSYFIDQMKRRRASDKEKDNAE